MRESPGSFKVYKLQIEEKKKELAHQRGKEIKKSMLAEMGS